jgi:hypothetical protein
LRDGPSTQSPGMLTIPLSLLSKPVSPDGVIDSAKVMPIQFGMTRRGDNFGITIWDFGMQIIDNGFIVFRIIILSSHPHIFTSSNSDFPYPTSEI